MPEKVWSQELLAEEAETLALWFLERDTSLPYAIAAFSLMLLRMGQAAAEMGNPLTKEMLTSTEMMLTATIKQLRED